MSYLKLYRKEALKHQYKSQEFGEAIVQQPQSVSHGILLLAFCLVLLGLAVLIVPLATSVSYQVRSHESNFQPIVFPYPVVVDEFRVFDGTEVLPDSVIGQVRYYPDGSVEQKFQAVKAMDAGFFFAGAEVGTTVSALQPIAKILRQNRNNLFHFWLDGDIPQVAENNQKVELVVGNLSVTGQIVSMQNSLSGGTKISVKLLPPFNKSILSPTHSIKLVISQRRNNVLALLRGN